MRDILKGTKSQGGVHRPQLLKKKKKEKKKKKRAEADSNRGPSAYQPNTLTLGQTGSPVALCIYTRIM